MHVVNVSDLPAGDVGPGDVIAVPAGVPHAFVSTGDVPQLSLHLAPEMLTEWLEP